MAAPRSVRVLEMRNLLSRLWVSGGPSQLQLQQVRHMALKRQLKRLKAPTVSAAKEAWVPLSARGQKKEKVMPKNYEEFLARVPTDDIWLRTDYPRPKYSMVQALDMHRELAAPEMMDFLQEGMVHVDAKLNMRTKKKTKFLSGVKNTVTLPHPFEDGSQNRIMAFCKSQEEKEKALEMGVVFAGGIDLIKSIKDGEIYFEDFDHVVCTVEMLVEVAEIRKFLKDDFPHQNKGSLGTDLEKMINFFTHGKTYSSTKESDATADVHILLGPLAMPTEHLWENFCAYMENLEAHRAKTATNVGPFIASALVCCPPSFEKFGLIGDDLVPPSQSKTKQTVSKVKETAAAAATAPAEEEEEEKEEEEDEAKESKESVTS